MSSRVVSLEHTNRVLGSYRSEFRSAEKGEGGRFLHGGQGRRLEGYVEDAPVDGKTTTPQVADFGQGAFLFAGHDALGASEGQAEFGSVEHLRSEQPT